MSLFLLRNSISCCNYNSRNDEKNVYLTHQRERKNEVSGMKETKGHVFSISRDNAPVAGCTISKELVNEAQYQVFYFSLAAVRKSTGRRKSFMSLTVR